MEENGTRSKTVQQQLEDLIQNFTGFSSKSPSGQRLLNDSKRHLSSTGGYAKWSVDQLIDQISVEILSVPNGAEINRKFTAMKQKLKGKYDVRDVSKILLLFKRLVQKNKEKTEWTLQAEPPKPVNRPVQKSPNPSKKRAPFSFPQQLSRPQKRVEISKELKLINELLAILQGFESKILTIKTEGDESWYCLPNESSASIREIVKRIGEYGIYYKHITSYIENCQKKTELQTGLVVQAFAGALNDEIEKYNSTLCVLHSSFRRSLDPFCKTREKLSLSKLRTWIEGPGKKLRLLQQFCFAVKKVRGGALISEIYKCYRSGSGFVREYTAMILNRICWPIFEMIRQWVILGDLQDPFDEFFILEEQVANEKLWTQKYKLRLKMMPVFIEKKLGKNIVSIGKTINFIRVCCEAEDWVDEVQLKYQRKDFSFTGISELSNMVESMRILTNKVLLKLLFEKYHFFSHVEALKKYLLLGQGDFIQCLLDLISPCLDQPASKVRQFTCEDILRQAISMSNAQYYKPDIIRRLGVRRLDAFSQSKEQAWNVFCLNYEVDSPINVVFHENVMSKYLRVFTFFLKLKRVKMKLSSIWKLHMSLANQSGIIEEFRELFHNSLMLRHEMWLLVQNMESYLMFDVLETAWKKFLSVSESVEDLTSLIDAHNGYMEEILNKSFLSAESSKLRIDLNDAFITILQFCTHQENLHEECINLRTIRGLMKSEGNPSIRSTKYYNADPEVTARKHSDQFNTFQTRFTEVLGSLMKELHKYEPFRSIAFQIDYNEYYKTQQHTIRKRTIKIPKKKSSTTSSSRLTSPFKKNFLDNPLTLGPSPRSGTITSRIRELQPSKFASAEPDPMRENQFAAWQRRVGMSPSSKLTSPPKKSRLIEKPQPREHVNSFFTSLLSGKKKSTEPSLASMDQKRSPERKSANSLMTKFASFDSPLINLDTMQVDD